jgi:CDP-ribitol ribitolphosphotransferase
VTAARIVLRIWLVRVGFAIGSFFSLRSNVLMATSHADHISGNLAAIHADLARRLPTIRVTVLAHRAGASPLASVKHAVTAGYHLARARLVVVDDYYFPLYVITPRRGTTVVQAWHASGALKKMGYSVEGKTFGAEPALLRRVRIHSNYDLCLVSARRFVPYYAEAFGLPLDRFRWDLGIPRTDPFFDAERRLRVEREVRERYAIPDDRRVILWAPTFRGDRVTDARDSGALDLSRLAAMVGDKQLLLLRLHPFVRTRTTIPPEAAAFARDVSNHPDIHDLMLVADVLVTDYSSAIFEFSLLERPMAFFAPDLEDYERERGFYVDYRTWVPGPVTTTTEELAAWLRDGVPDLDRVRRFREAAFAVADGRATERVVDRVIVPGLDAPG